VHVSLTDLICSFWHGRDLASVPDHGAHVDERLLTRISERLAGWLASTISVDGQRAASPKLEAAPKVGLDAPRNDQSRIGAKRHGVARSSNLIDYSDAIGFEIIKRELIVRDADPQKRGD